MKTVTPAIYELLKGITAINVAGQVRVYAGRAPDNATAPYIVYQETDSERWRSINNQSGIAQAYIQVDAYADKPFAASMLGADVETALVDHRGIVPYGTGSPRPSVRIAGISFQNGSDMIDQTEKPFLHRRYAVYLVTYEQ